MPSTIRLTIDLDARLRGIDQTIEGLKKTEAAGKSFNQALKTTSIDQMKLALERAYQANAIYNGEVKASTMYLRDQKKAMDAIAVSLGKGPMTVTDSSGITQQVTTMKEAYTQFADLTQFVDDNASFAKAGQGATAFNLSGFYSDMEKDAKVAGLFGTELDQVDTKLASLRAKISEQYRIQLDMKDLDAINAKMDALQAKRAGIQTYLDKANEPGSYGGDADEQAKQQALYNAELTKTNTQIAGVEKERDIYTKNAASIKDMQEQYVKLSATREDMTKYSGDEFFSNLDKQSEGVRMFGTELDDVRMRMQAIKSQGMDLKMKGGDPEEIQRLSDEYKHLEVRSNALSKATNGTGTRIKNLVKNFVSAQLVVYGIRTAFSLLVNGFKDSTNAAAAAIETANLFNTTFAKVATSAAAAASALSTQFGLAISTAQNAIGTFGDLAIGFGATSGAALEFANSATRTQMDLISFKNITGDLAELQKNFASGLAGNNKNFRQYGVIVKETDVAHRLAMKGLDKLTGSELALAKMQERLNIVIEQSPNAIGDMVKTFDSAQNVQRRYSEGMKELKENIGEWALPALTTMRLFILSHVDAYNLAERARKNYESGKSIPLVDISTDEGVKKAKEAISKFFEKEQGTATILGVTYSIDIENIEKAARSFGVTGQWILDNVLGKSGKKLKEQVTLLDQLIEKERLLAKADEDRNTATQKYVSTLSSLVDKVSEVGKVYPDISVDEKAKPGTATNQAITGLDSMIQDFIGKAPSEFVAGIEGALGNFDLSKALGDKNKAASNIYDALDNALIRAKTNMDKYLEDAKSATDQIDKDEYTNLANNEQWLIAMLITSMSKVTENYGKSLSQINYDTQNKTLDTQLAQLGKKNELEQQFIYNGSEVVNSLMTQFNAEQALATLLKEKKITQDDYNKLLEKSNKYYDQDVEKAKALYDLNKSMSDMSATMNPFGDDQRMSEYISYLKTVNESNIALAASFGLLKDGKIDASSADKETLDKYNEARLKLQSDAERDYTNAIKKIQKEVVDSLGDLRKALDEENKNLRQSLAIPYNETAIQTAERERTDATGSNASLVKKSVESFLSPSELKAIKDSGGALSAEMMLSATEMAQVTKYRKDLEVNAELEYQKSLKDARDGSLQTIESLWEGLGDVGMIKDWIATYSNTKEYEISEGKDEDLASAIASSKTWIQIIIEFASHVKVVNDILSLVTTSFEELGPIVSDFLQPFVPIITTLIDMGNILVPILTLLMPLIKLLATVIVMVIEPFETLTKVIQYAIGKITFWTSADDIAWSEVQNIHSDNLQTIEDIWNMEIDARASYVSELTDAQQGEIDAYKKMYESGLLDLSQYLSLRNSVTGTNQTSEVQAFAEGGDFVTNGPKTIMVGDNPGGREHVVIEPLSSSNSYASLGNTKSMASNGNTYAPTFYITSDNPKEVARSVEDLLATMSRRGESYAS